MAVAQAVVVDHDGHLDARAEFAGLRLRGENRDLRGREVLQDSLGHEPERATRVMFEHEKAVIGADLFHFGLQSRRDRARRLVGDDRDPLVRLEAQAHFDGVARARDQFRIDGMEKGTVGHGKAMILTRNRGASKPARRSGHRRRGAPKSGERLPRNGERPRVAGLHVRRDIDASAAADCTAKYR